MVRSYGPPTHSSASSSGGYGCQLTGWTSKGECWAGLLLLGSPLFERIGIPAQAGGPLQKKGPPDRGGVVADLVRISRMPIGLS